MKASGPVRNSYTQEVDISHYIRRLGGVEYRVANNPGDYAAARKLIKEKNVEAPKLTFPTILAWKDGELLGLLGTYVKQSVPYLGPLVLKYPSRPFTGIRLLDSYDNVMRATGVEAYAIFVYKEEGDMQKWIELMPGAKLRATTDEGWHYIRRL